MFSQIYKDIYLQKKEGIEDYKIADKIFNEQTKYNIPQSLSQQEIETLIKQVIPQISNLKFVFWALHVLAWASVVFMISLMVGFQFFRFGIAINLLFIAKGLFDLRYAKINGLYWIIIACTSLLYHYRDTFINYQEYLNPIDFAIFFVSLVVIVFLITSFLLAVGKGWINLQSNR